VRVVALLAVLAGLTALVLNLQPPSQIDPYEDWLGRLTPICYAGIVWLYVSIFLVAAYFRVPVHPFHRAVILGFVLFLTVSTGALGSSAHENLLGFAWQKLSTPLFSTGVASAALALSTPVSFPT
jgi:hypothetical protein